MDDQRRGVLKMAFPSHPVATLFLSGPSGRLEAITTWPENNMVSAVAIICHPHPLYQGTMHNKVVSTLARTFAKQGLATVRFNYRGVGRSEGHYGDMQGEIQDLLAIKAWVNEHLPRLPIWLAGFSFGAFISACVAHQATDVQQLISVAPAINHADFYALTKITCPWLVIQGAQDEVVPFAEVQQFALASPVPLRFVVLPEAGHFFHGRLLELQSAIEENVFKKS